MTPYWDYYAPSRPKEVKGGIKAKSKRGKFGENWWARRWIEVLESFNIGARLTRGKSYARKGQVLSIKIETGLVRAKVQGSSSTPYSVTIKIRTLTGSEWDLLAKKLAQKPIFAAKLLAGEMPEELESVFMEAGLSLFPEKIDDLDTDCSCPDWSVPCKHIAAVYYLMAEEFDRYPFLLFKLRGVDMDDFMSVLGHAEPEEDFEEEPGEGAKLGAEARAGAESGILSPKARAAPLLVLEEEEGTYTLSPEPLPLDLETFWGKVFERTEKEMETRSKAHIPSVPAALPKSLGKFPFWRGEEDLLDGLEEIYRQASPVGMRVFLGEEAKAEGE
ncbi:MAG: SWIM zinc finger family protein [Methanosarcinaceae archaeon]